MGGSLRRSSIWLVCVLGMVLLVWAAPAAADEGSGRKTRTDLSYIFDKEAFGIKGLQAEAGGAEGISKLSLRLYGGYSHVLAGDVNEGSDFYFEIFEAYAAEKAFTMTGGYKPLHGGYNFGADIIYQLSPAVGIGLGFGYMSSSSDSLGTFTFESMDYALTAAAALKAMPISLGAFFTFPLSPKLDLTAGAGAAYYMGLEFEGTQAHEDPGGWMNLSLEACERSGADIGFHGNLGIEYKLSPKLGLFVEAVGRYAKFKNFEMVTGTQVINGGAPVTTEGKLYLVEYDWDDYDISGFTIVETGGIPEPEWREPKIDLSGFSLQAGIRIRF